MGVLMLAHASVPITPARFGRVASLAGVSAQRLARDQGFLLPLVASYGVLVVPRKLLTYLRASASILGVAAWVGLVLLLVSGDFAQRMQGPCNAAYLSVDFAFMLINLAGVPRMVRRSHESSWVRALLFGAVLLVQGWVTTCASCIEDGHMTSPYDGRTVYMEFAFRSVFLCGVPLVAHQARLVRHVLYQSWTSSCTYKFAGILAACILWYTAVVFLSVNSIAIGWTLVAAQYTLLHVDLDALEAQDAWDQLVRAQWC